MVLGDGMNRDGGWQGGRARSATTTVALALIAPADAEIRARPTPTAVTTPAAETDETAGALLAQTSPVDTRAPEALLASARRFAVCPMRSDSNDDSRAGLRLGV